MTLSVSNEKLTDEQSRNLFNQMNEYYPEINGVGHYNFSGDFTTEFAQSILNFAQYEEIDDFIVIKCDDGAAFLVDRNR